MSLKETLKQLKASSRAKMPVAAVETIGRATERLEASGILRMALGPGDSAPDFELPDQTGNNYSSAELLPEGPLVLNFFRGAW